MIRIFFYLYKLETSSKLLIKYTKNMKKLIVILTALSLFSSCKKDEKKVEETPQTTPPPANDCPTCEFPDTVYSASVTGPKLILRIKLDSTQQRLNNLAQPTVVASGNAAQSPRFNGISAHYVELAANDNVAVGAGKVLYVANETTCGGSKAITFCKSLVVKNNDIFLEVPLSSIPAGSYKWMRVSLAYQNYDIKIKTTSAGIIDGTLASFVGFNTYVTKYKMKGAAGGPGNKSQGYWGLYTNVLGVPYRFDGSSPATTVVNPINSTSPIPAGSCLVTGSFVTNANPNVGAPLVITGTETSNITVTISLSTNKSFEWKEVTFDGYFQPDANETVVDMGLRGLLAKY
jgi:uncharacterized protein with FMN-binding domain